MSERVGGQIKYILRVVACLLVALAGIACASSVDDIDEVVYAQESPSVETSATIVTSTVANIEGEIITTLTQDTATDRTRVLGPAWTDQQRWFNPQSEAAFEIYRDYILNNPNDLSTPMGALCWAQHVGDSCINYLTALDGQDILYWRIENANL